MSWLVRTGQYVQHSCRKHSQAHLVNCQCPQRFSRWHCLPPRAAMQAATVAPLLASQALSFPPYFPSSFVLAWIVTMAVVTKMPHDLLHLIWTSPSVHPHPPSNASYFDPQGQDKTAYAELLPRDVMEGQIEEVTERLRARRKPTHRSQYCGGRQGHHGWERRSAQPKQ